MFGWKLNFTLCNLWKGMVLMIWDMCVIFRWKEELWDIGCAKFYISVSKRLWGWQYEWVYIECSWSTNYFWMDWRWVKTTALPQENHFNLVNHLGLNLKMGSLFEKKWGSSIDKKRDLVDILHDFTFCCQVGYILLCSISFNWSLVSNIDGGWLWLGYKE